jgi:hypothetical protein
MQPVDQKRRILVVLVVMVIFLGITISFFWPILKELNNARQNGNHGSNVPLLMFGGFFLVMVLMAVASVVRATRSKPKLSPLAAERSPNDKPWLARDDWAAGRVKSSDLGQVKIMAFMGIVFCAMGGLFTAVILPKELHNGNYAALFILFFPLVGLGFLTAVLRVVLARRRYGDCVFEMAAIPGALNGTLEGIIQTGARLEPEHGIQLKLSCIRRVTTGSGKNRSTQEHVLWQDEKVLKADAGLPEPEPGHTGIPIYFRLPADQPESTVGSGDGIHWRLEARAKMPGMSFHTTFIVPVFKVAGAAAMEADEPDPTATLQMPIEELRRDEHSRIRVSDGPDGREFYFPPARNPGAAIIVTLFFVVWSGIFWFLLHTHAPVIFPVVWGVTDVLVAYGCLNAWFSSSRINIDSTNVRVTSRLLLFGRSRQFSSAEVSRFTTAPGMQSGTKTYTNIKLVKRGDDDTAETGADSSPPPQQIDQLLAARFRAVRTSGVTVASAISDVAEANWLAAEMNKALGRK